MSEIYKIHDENGKDKLLVSKEYVDLRFKALRDFLGFQIAKNENTAIAEPLDNAEVVSLDINGIGSGVISANSIAQDTNHRFINDNQLKSMASKASIHEMNQAINDAKNDLQAIFNDQYVRLLNLPKAIATLREIANLVKDDVNFSSLIETMRDKLSQEDLDNHIASNMHLTSDDREALAILVSKYTDGILESLGEKCKVSERTEMASDSYKLSGLSITQVHKCKKEDSIIGTSDIYKEDEVDIVLENGNLAELIKIALVSGYITFKPGKYHNDIWKINRNKSADDLIINGCGSGTKFIIDKLLELNNIQFKECYIKSPIINILSRVSFTDVVFDSCNINLSSSELDTFRNCTFKNCKITFNNVCRGIRFFDCIFDGTEIPKYIGPQNIYVNNIKI